MSRKRWVLSASDCTRHQALRGVPCHQARFMLFPDIRSPRYSASLEPSSTLDQLGCGETAIDHYTYGIIDSRVPLLQDNSRVILPPKPAAASSSPLTITSPQSNARHDPKNGQAWRRPVKPPGSNIRLYLDFVSMTLREEGAAHRSIKRSGIFMR